MTLNDDLFISCDKHELMASQGEAYAHLQELLGRTENAHAQLKERRGQLLPDSHKAEDLKLRRRRAWEVAYARLSLLATDIYEASRSLLEMTARLREEAAKDTGGEDSFPYDLAPIAQNNVVCAEELADEALTLYYQLTQVVLRSERFAWHYSAIKRAFQEPKDTGRHFVVMYSGHGSRHRFEGSDPDSPPPGPYLTETEAGRDAANWESTADTIGGSAIVVDVRKKPYPNY